MAADATQDPQTAAADHLGSSRRRRLPLAAEHARRKAWGREWGGMIGAYWQARRAAGYTTGRR